MKTLYRFVNQNNNFARITLFLYISMPSLHDCDVKTLNCTFYGGRKQATTNSKLECGPQEINSWEMPQICHFQRIGRNATKFKKTRIQFKSDVFATVVIVDTKAP